MPSNTVHNGICKYLFGKEYADINSFIDAAHKRLGSWHRIHRHEPKVAVQQEMYEKFVKSGVYPEDEWPILLKVLEVHIAVDLNDSERTEGIKIRDLKIERLQNDIGTYRKIAEDQKLEIRQLQAELTKFKYNSCYDCPINIQAQDLQKLRDEKQFEETVIGELAKEWIREKEEKQRLRAVLLFTLGVLSRYLTRSGELSALKNTDGARRWPLYDFSLKLEELALLNASDKKKSEQISKELDVFIQKQYAIMLEIIRPSD